MTIDQSRYIVNPGPKKPVTGLRAAVTTDSAIVTETTVNVLKSGGNAADAGIPGALDCDWPNGSGVRLLYRAACGRRGAVDHRQRTEPFARHVGPPCPHADRARRIRRLIRKGRSVPKPDLKIFCYSVVGAGAAGSIVAARLAEDPAVGVRVLEAGPSDRRAYVHISAGFTKTLSQEAITWQFETEPTVNTAGRRIHTTQGRVVGGSGSVNGMIYIGGQPQDYDHWEQLGDRGYQEGKHYTLDIYSGVTAGAWQHRPLSRSFVRARSPDPFEDRLVQPNYLEHETDRQVMVAGMKLMRALLHRPDPRDHLVGKTVPGPAIATDAQLLDFCCNHGSTGYHLVGTARMGPRGDTLAVVDDHLRVIGLDVLRVVDVSAMPMIPWANTYAVTLMIAEKAADLISA